MKPLALLAASLAIPVVIASAQTPSTPSTTTTSNGQLPFIPLISGGGGTTLTGTPPPSSTWFIDTTRSLVVFCAQSATNTSGTAPSFTCSAQAVPTAASGGTSGGGTPATGSGTSGGEPTGGAGANPMGG
ncbi:MAG TPA: hypothetical protein VJ652_01460 [Noviherbaspirillum sp.]|nr:hypothetical protein [Noviherbaspirillum sp.]